MMIEQFRQTVIHPPITTPITGSSMLTHEWARFFSSLNLFLAGFTQYGIQVPNMSVAIRDQLTNIQKGTLIFNTDSNKLQVYNGSAWETITSS